MNLFLDNKMAAITATIAMMFNINTYLVFFGSPDLLRFSLPLTGLPDGIVNPLMSERLL
jgi:hypothetical protein